MQNTTMTVQRSKVPLRTKLPVRIENMAFREAAELGGQSPYDSFWIFSTGGGTIDVRRGDLLIDELNIDPITGNKALYRVFGNPENFFADHAEIPAEKIVGT